MSLLFVDGDLLNFEYDCIPPVMRIRDGLTTSVTLPKLDYIGFFGDIAFLTGLAELSYGLLIGSYSDVTFLDIFLWPRTYPCIGSAGFLTWSSLTWW